MSMASALRHVRSIIWSWIRDNMRWMYHHLSTVFSAFLHNNDGEDPTTAVKKLCVVNLMPMRLHVADSDEIIATRYEIAFRTKEVMEATLRHDADTFLRLASPLSYSIHDTTSGEGVQTVTRSEYENFFRGNSYQSLYPDVIARYTTILSPCVQLHGHDVATIHYVRNSRLVRKSGQQHGSNPIHERMEWKLMNGSWRYTRLESSRLPFNTRHKRRRTRTM